MASKESLATQNFIDVDRIEDDTVVLKSGGLRKILIASGVNIELKSEDEQTVIYSEYQKFLNSLDFPLQFLVHSRKLNIDKYLKFLEDRETEEADDILKNQLLEYQNFIKSFVAENDIMVKNFFIIVPYDSPILPSRKQIVKSLPKFFSFKRAGATENKGGAETENEEVQKTVFQLNQRVEHVISGVRAIGLRAVALNREELLELFYNLYNPESAEKKDINLSENDQ